MLEIPVIRSAEYKLPITREICICMFSLYIKMKFKKNYYYYYYYYYQTFRLPSLLITLPPLLFPSVEASFKGIASAPYFSTYALIHLFKSLSKINTNNSVSLHMILLIVSLTLFIGSNSQMTQRSLQLTSAKINSF